LGTVTPGDRSGKVVVTTLVSDVATAYFTVRELDYELEISKRMLDTRRTSLQLVQSRSTSELIRLFAKSRLGQF
jgi:outer membrane protein TolC